MHQQIEKDWPEIIADKSSWDFQPEYSSWKYGAPVYEKIIKSRSVRVVYNADIFWATGCGIQMSGPSSLVAVLRWYVALTLRSDWVEVPIEYA